MTNIEVRKLINFLIQLLSALSFMWNSLELCATYICIQTQRLSFNPDLNFIAFITKEMQTLSYLSKRYDISEEEQLIASSFSLVNPRPESLQINKPPGSLLELLCYIDIDSLSSQL